VERRVVLKSSIEEKMSGARTNVIDYSVVFELGTNNTQLLPSPKRTD